MSPLAASSIFCLTMNCPDVNFGWNIRFAPSCRRLHPKRFSGLSDQGLWYMLSFESSNSLIGMISLRCMLSCTTVPRARGRPHSLLSRSRNNSSLIFIDNKSDEGSAPALAAWARPSHHASTFAAYPSGFVVCR